MGIQHTASPVPLHTLLGCSPDALRSISLAEFSIHASTQKSGRAALHSPDNSPEAHREKLAIRPNQTHTERAARRTAIGDKSIFFPPSKTPDTRFLSIYLTLQKHNALVLHAPAAQEKAAARERAREISPASTPDSHTSLWLRKAPSPAQSLPPTDVKVTVTWLDANQKSIGRRSNRSGALVSIGRLSYSCLHV